MEKRFGLDTIKNIVFSDNRVGDSDLQWDKIEKSYSFLESFSKDKIIYGINTGFGPMAQWRVDDRSLKDLQYNIIRSHSTGAGEPLPDEYV